MTYCTHHASKQHSTGIHTTAHIMTIKIVDSQYSFHPSRVSVITSFQEIWSHNQDYPSILIQPTKTNKKSRTTTKGHRDITKSPKSDSRISQGIHLLKDLPLQFVWSDTWVVFTASSKWDWIGKQGAVHWHVSTENSWGNRFLNFTA